MKEKIGTLLKKQNYWLQFSKLHFLLKLVFPKFCYPKPVAGTGSEARQNWTGSTKLHVGLSKSSYLMRFEQNDLKIVSNLLKTPTCI